MLNILIVDDEKYIRDELKYFLEKYDDVNICGECGEGEEAIEMSKNLEPDVVFLDIELQDMNGILVARRLLERKKIPFIVFATAYDDYAIQGFEMEAVDYLVKPFLEDRIKVTLDRIRRQYELKRGNSGKTEVDIKLDKLCVNKGERIVLLDIKEIKYIHSVDHNIIVHTLKDKYTCNYTLKELEGRFKSEKLIRTHKGYIVNIDYVNEIIPWFNYTYKIKLKDGENTEIPVSRNYLKQFKNILGL